MGKALVAAIIVSSASRVDIGLQSAGELKQIHKVRLDKRRFASVPYRTRRAPPVLCTRTVNSLHNLLCAGQGGDLNGFCFLFVTLELILKLYI